MFAMSYLWFTIYCTCGEKEGAAFTCVFLSNSVSFLSVFVETITKPLLWWEEKKKRAELLEN